MHPVDQARAQERRREPAAALDQALVHAELARAPARPLSRSRCAPRLRTGTTRAPARSSRRASRAGRIARAAGDRAVRAARRRGCARSRACAGASRPPRAAGCARPVPPRRARSSGSSARSVFEPTATASVRARRRCTNARAGSEVIQRDSPVAVAIRPSRLAASFSVVNGRPRSTRETKPSWWRAQASSSTPRATVDARARELADARAARARIGIDQPDHHALRARGDHGVDTGRCAAPVRARLERDVERRAARGGAGARERDRLGVRLEPARRAARDHAAGLHEQRPHRRIRRGAQARARGRRRAPRA